METAGIDLSRMSKFTPERVKKKYREIVPTVISANPNLNLTTQNVYEFISAAEKETGGFLYGVSLSEEASSLQAEMFNRRFLRLKKKLNISNEEENQKLEAIDKSFSDAANELARIRRIPVDEADNLLMGVSQYRELKGLDDGVERLTKGPKIINFEKSESFNFNYTNGDIKDFLETSLGLETILNSRLIEVRKASGFPIVCRDIEFGNTCMSEYGAKWEGGYLVLPDLNSYLSVEKKLEGKTESIELDHTFKLRASTESSRDYSTITVYDFAVEKPSHYDYLHDLPISDEEKMTSYYLGIFAHETTHAIQDVVLDKSKIDEFFTITKTEQSSVLRHSFVSQYVDNHNNVFKSSEKAVASEDLAESVRIYMTNSDYLRRYFPRRYNFIQENMKFAQENAILDFMAKKKTAPNK